MATVENNFVLSDEPATIARTQPHVRNITDVWPPWYTVTAIYNAIFKDREDIPIVPNCLTGHCEFPFTELWQSFPLCVDISHTLPIEYFTYMCS
jgi:hypothetical protein